MDRYLKSLQRRVGQGDPEALRELIAYSNRVGGPEYGPLPLPDISMVGGDEAPPEGISQEQWISGLHERYWREVLSRDDDQETIFVLVSPMEEVVEVHEVIRQFPDEASAPYQINEYEYSFDDLRWDGPNQENILYFLNEYSESEAPLFGEALKTNRRGWVNMDVARRAAFLANLTGKSKKSSYVWGPDTLPEAPEEIIWNRVWAGQEPNNPYTNNPRFDYDAEFRFEREEFGDWEDDD